MTLRTISTLFPGELSTLLGGRGVRLHVPPFVIHIQSQIPVVSEGLGRLYADHICLDEEDSFADFHVAVLLKRRLFRPLCAFEMDGFQPFTPLAAGEAFAFLEWGMNWCVTSYCHTLITIHSAVLERDGRALILPAPPGSGKSTLCAALMLNGWRLLSDEMALLDPVTGFVTPSPRPVSLKNQSIEIIQRMAPHAVFGPVAHDTMKGTVAHMKVSQDSLARSHVAALPAWLVFPRYQAGSTTRPEAHPKPASLMQLAENSFNHHVHGRHGFDALARVVDRSDCYNLTYSQLPEAIDWFNHLPLPAA